MLGGEVVEVVEALLHQAVLQQGRTGGGLLLSSQGGAGGELLPHHDQPVQQVQEVKEGLNTEC